MWTAERSLARPLTGRRSTDTRIGRLRHAARRSPSQRERTNQGVLRTSASNLGTPLKTCDFCYCRLI